MLFLQRMVEPGSKMDYTNIIIQLFSEEGKVCYEG